jgi:thiol-disulfide isomerase/thioredoxin
MSSDTKQILFDRRRFLGAAVMTLAGAAGSADTQSIELSPPVEGEMPSVSSATGWLNSQPLTVEGLRGKVVLIDFWTYSCINWRRTLPFVRAWSEKYKDHGLVTIGVHTPEFGFEKNIENVRWAVKNMDVDYPVAMDSNYGVWRAFKNEYWPALYFVDTKGRIRRLRP